MYPEVAPNRGANPEVAERERVSLGIDLIPAGSPFHTLIISTKGANSSKIVLGEGWGRWISRCLGRGTDDVMEGGWGLQVRERTESDRLVREERDRRRDT